MTMMLLINSNIMFFSLNISECLIYHPLEWHNKSTKVVNISMKYSLFHINCSLLKRFLDIMELLQFQKLLL